MLRRALPLRAVAQLRSPRAERIPETRSLLVVLVAPPVVEPVVRSVDIVLPGDIVEPVPVVADGPGAPPLVVLVVPLVVPPGVVPLVVPLLVPVVPPLVAVVPLVVPVLPVVAPVVPPVVPLVAPPVAVDPVAAAPPLVPLLPEPLVCA